MDLVFFVSKDLLFEHINHEDIYRYELNNVFVNGNWIGFTKSAIDLADKFRKMRRGPDIKLDPYVTIHRELNAK